MNKESSVWGPRNFDGKSWIARETSKCRLQRQGQQQVLISCRLEIGNSALIVIN